MTPTEPKGPPYGDTHEERVRELSETGKSIRYTGKPMFTMIREALEREYGEPGTEG